MAAEIYERHSRGVRNLCATVLLSATICLSFPAMQVQAAAKVKIDSAVIDFGELTGQADKKERTITVANTGSDALQLKYLGSSCGCTEVQYDNNVPPGGTREMVVEVDPRKAGKGQKLQKLLFSTNDPDLPRLVIDVLYRAKLGQVEVSPDAIQIELSKQETQNMSGRAKNTIVVFDTWTERLEISDIQTSEHLKTCLYDILFLCPNGGETHILRFDTFLLPDTPLGPFNEWLKFSTNHPKYPAVTVPVSGRILGSVRVTPKMLLYRSVVPGRPLPVKTVRIEATGDDDILEIEQISASETWIHIEKHTVDTRKIELRILIKEMPPEVYHDKGPILKSKITVKIKQPDRVEETFDVLMLKG